MAETMALAIIRPLLGLLRNEAKLLRGVRGDVQFIKDEMESVKGFLLNLAARTREGGRADHQVRAWIEQVMELAYDSKNCVEDYTQSGRMSPHGGRGLMRRIKWAVRLPRRILVRRRIAARIRQLKIRARDVGQRQKRYAVAVPPPLKMDTTTRTTTGAVTIDFWNDPQAGSGGPRGQNHHQQPSSHPPKDSPRWAVLSADILTEAKQELLQWLAVKPEDHHTRPWPSVLAVVTPDGVNGASLADQVYKHCENPFNNGDLKFDYVVRIKIKSPSFLLVILLDMLRQLQPHYFMSPGNGTETWDLAQATEKLKELLRGKSLLLVLSDLDHPDIWDYIKQSLEKLECSAGSAVLFSTNNKKLADRCSPDECKIYTLVGFYYQKAVSLVPSKFDPKDNQPLRGTIREVLTKCKPDVYCMNLLLRALLSNPNRTVQELKSLSWSLAPAQCPTKIDKHKRMLMFCYHGLSNEYKNCLWYSTAFTRGTFKVRRASLLRRWVAEGLIKSGGQYSTEEAERCFDALVTQKLLLPSELDSTGRIKSCGLDPLFASMVTDVEADEAFLDANQMPADLELHFSIRNGIQLRRMLQINSSTTDSTVSLKNKKTEQQMKMMAFLNHLPSSSSFRLLRVLELEGFKGFNKRHLNNICKIHQLKYLSLRDTDVVQLPKEIDKLEQLETFDIRGTKVQELNAVLPMLKHLLAGSIDYKQGHGDNVKSNELFTTVRMPKDVSKMDKLEILSHVKVYSSGKDLANIGDKMKKMRKLGVVLCGKKANMKDLFHQIDELNECLVSLSIRVEPSIKWDTVDGATVTPPRLLESLTICDVRGWLPARINELHRLVKITLRGTYLKEGALAILGSLGSLLRLRLRFHSFAEAALAFRNGQFGKLIELVIEDDDLRSLRFEHGTAPKLSTMVWSFTRMDSITGIKNLVSLQRLELNKGKCDSAGLEELQQDISTHCKKVRFSLNPPENNQGSEADAAVTAR
ncbi:hypothetical protein PR202_ga22650 [Eleusine coracana subsp. coracana]|uniref:Rx N-terminal domain-containing protein n=1 Tax=Eleusine coracana subsp. coracana TaxID=191504 RepID=A0AAV5D4K7_ELECO|nr:hypothetical protein PR202_ga22650 [Eleusine coracana subsp. coracana]